MKTFLLGLTLFFSATSLYAQSANDIVGRLKRKYDSISGMKARFTQEMRGQSSASTSGEIIMQGSKYRITTPQLTKVTNGSTVWDYSAAEKQVLVNNYVDGENAFSPSSFFVTNADRYRIIKVDDQTLNGKPHWILKLYPRNSDAFMREITLFIRQEDTIPTKFRVVDKNNNNATFSLSNIQLNPRIRQNTFNFSAPRGVEVIDLR
jgi:outer membrane lipoprotein carrier protein